jgi:hypothetical protein
VTVEIRERMVSKGQEDYLDQREIQEREVQEESWDKLDLKDQLENLELQGVEACLVQMVHREQRDQLVIEV